MSTDCLTKVNCIQILGKINATGSWKRKEWFALVSVSYNLQSKIPKNSEKCRYSREAYKSEYLITFLAHFPDNSPTYPFQPPMIIIISKMIFEHKRRVGLISFGPYYLYRCNKVLNNHVASVSSLCKCRDRKINFCLEVFMGNLRFDF